jgi:hypothetical protein
VDLAAGGADRALAVVVGRDAVGDGVPQTRQCLMRRGANMARQCSGEGHRACASAATPPDAREGLRAAFLEIPMSFVFDPAPDRGRAGGRRRQFPVHRIYCVGRNYVEHAQEMGFTGREPPFFFMKPADAIVAVPEGRDRRQMPYPRAPPTCTTRSNWWPPSARAAATSAADAAAHVWGYAVGLDMTRRDLQGEMKKQGRPWCIGKAFDQSAPIGPIVPIGATGD